MAIFRASESQGLALHRYVLTHMAVIDCAVTPGAVNSESER